MAEVTAIIPCFNGGRLLEEAIDSLTEQDVAIDVVVVDDGSTDGSESRATSKGARVVRHETNLGVAAAINSGVAAAETDLVLILAADDLVAPGAVKTVVAAAATKPEVGVFIPEVDLVDIETGELIWECRLKQPILDVHRLLAMDGNPQTCGVVYRRSVLLEHPYRTVGDGSGKVLGCEDWQNWIELALAGVKAVEVEGARGIYRRRIGSVSMNVGRKWRSGQIVLADDRLRHPNCPECVKAVAQGRDALRDYCFSMDLVQIFGSDAGNRISRMLQVSMRDPILIPRLAHSVAWRSRDRLRAAFLRS